MLLALDRNSVGVTSATTYPLRTVDLPANESSTGRYAVRWARTAAELDEVLRLRFEVFNLELGEGLEESFHTGRDRDEFDATCHHLIVTERATSRIIGTYRLRTQELARNNGGFYSAGEFDMSHLPASFMSQAVEIGRACIARAYRNSKVLMLLWHGLVRYAQHNRKRYFFGCGSLPSQDPLEGQFIYRRLQQDGHEHPTLQVVPQAGYECNTQVADEIEFSTPIPPLCQSYLRFGAKICGPPALDREFKTIDFLVAFDLHTMNPRLRQMLL